MTWRHSSSHNQCSPLVIGFWATIRRVLNGPWNHRLCGSSVKTIASCCETNGTSGALTADRTRRMRGKDLPTKFIPTIPNLNAIKVRYGIVLGHYFMLLNVDGLCQHAVYSLASWLLMSLPSRQLSLRRLAVPHVFLIICNNNPPQEANNNNRDILYVCFQLDYLHYTP